MTVVNTPSVGKTLTAEKTPIVVSAPTMAEVSTAVSDLLETRLVDSLTVKDVLLRATPVATSSLISDILYSVSRDSQTKCPLWEALGLEIIGSDDGKGNSLSSNDDSHDDYPHYLKANRKVADVLGDVVGRVAEAGV